MKVAMLSSSVSRAAGGIFEAERRLSLELAGALDYDLGVFAVKDAFSDADMEVWRPLQPNVYPCIGPGAFGYSPGLLEGLTDWNPDLVHLHTLWMYPSVITQRWSRLTRRPYMITLHGMLDAWALNNSSWKKKLALALYERRNFTGAGCIQVLSLAEADSARKFGLRNPLAIIPNGMDVPRNAAPAEPIGDRRTLLFLGRLHPKKGLLNLLRAWNAVMNTDKGLAWDLRIAGWSEVGHENELTTLAAELNMPIETADKGPNPKARVKFSGPQFGADKELCLQDCDGFILPSLSEGLPMSVLEAWSYGKPVVMTDMCNLPEGFAAKAAIQTQPTMDSLKVSLLKLMSMNDAQRQEMGRRGRRLVESHFTWSRVRTQMTEVYDWMLHGGAAPSCIVF
jgi:glycosyltransferase involved in cell wall biosynthesis